jgi:hypothetical protein
MVPNETAHLQDSNLVKILSDEGLAQSQRQTAGSLLFQRSPRRSLTTVRQRLTGLGFRPGADVSVATGGCFAGVLVFVTFAGRSTGMLSVSEGRTRWERGRGGRGARTASKTGSD